MLFSDIDGLDENILKALTHHGYHTPSQIQLKTIPHTLQGQHVIGQGASGTGKTAGFVIAVLQKIDLNFSHPPSFNLGPIDVCPEIKTPTPQRLQALILTPTREVALQNANEVVKLGKYLRREHSPVKETEDTETGDMKDTAGDMKETGELRCLACVGGVTIHADLLALRVRQPHIMVATTGRMLSLLHDDSSEAKKRRGKISQRKLNTYRYVLPPLKVIVFDEADRLLGDNFQAQTLSLVKHLSEIEDLHSQILLYSATFSPQLLSLVEKIVYTLTQRNDDLHVIVDGIDPEPPADVDPYHILRKCFVVSSFILHGPSNEFKEGEAVQSATVPLRLDEMAVGTKSNIQLDTPNLQNVKNWYLSLNEEVTLETLCSRLTDAFHLSSAHNLNSLLTWCRQDEEWTHWDDLLPKFLVITALLLEHKKQNGDTSETARDMKETAGDMKATGGDMKETGGDMKATGGDMKGGHKGGSFLIFCNDIFSGEKIAMTLTAMGLECAYVNARLSQPIRSRHLRALSEGRLRGLVCSDVLARGIDLPGVNFVLAIDLPQDKETVMHRIGRAGRFGRKGEFYWVMRASDEMHTLKLFSIQTGFPLHSFAL